MKYKGNKMNNVYWFSTKKATGIVEVDAGIIKKTAPIWKKWRGKSLREFCEHLIKIDGKEVKWELLKENR